MNRISKMLARFLLVYMVIFPSSYAQQMLKEHQQWLKDKFDEQHQQISAVVAVADIFYGCNLERKTDPSMPNIPTLITKVDRNVLADKLRACLQGESINSERAIYFGLIGCFDEQLKHLSEQEQRVKKKLVVQAIKRLSKEEQQKSFTQCVTDQAIPYLK